MWNMGLLGASAPVAAGSYELIESSILTSDTSSVTFSSIPQDYKHLQIRMLVRDTNTFTNELRNITLLLNGSSSGNSHRLTGNGSTVASASLGPLQIFNGTLNDDAPSGVFVATVLDILDYTNTSKNTTTRSLGGTEAGATLARAITLGSGLLLSTNAITSITINSLVNHKTGSRFSLYGIK